MILPELLRLLEGWKGAFAQARTHIMAVQMALAILWVLGRNTVSQRTTLLRQHRVDWNRCYRLFSRRPWELAELFGSVIPGACQGAAERFTSNRPLPGPDACSRQMALMGNTKLRREGGWGVGGPRTRQPVPNLHR